MTSDELLALLGPHFEKDRVEFTVATDKTDKFCQAICAFANDLPNHQKPGHLLIGVKDDGSLSGLKQDDRLLQQLGGIRSDGNILPPPTIFLETHSFPQGDVIVVSVAPAMLPPVRYKGQVWIRIGPRKGIATEQEERQLAERRQSLLLPFDASPMPEASKEDLSRHLFGEYRRLLVADDVIEANHRSFEEQLASLRFFDLRRQAPTPAGILVVGTNPRYYLPGAYVQFVRVRGETLVDGAADQKALSGDLQSLAQSLIQLVDVQVQTSLEVDTFHHKTHSEYPVRALRELLFNAIMHRDYASFTPVRFYWFSDRIEIQSPGGFYGGVTQETVRRRNSYRNPTIAEAMKALGYVERFGSGIQTVDRLLLKNGNPPLELSVEDSIVLATVRRAS